MKILLIWPYRRRDWIEVFSQLRDRFDFVFLATIHSSLDDTLPDFGTVVHWSDFDNAADVLERIKPEKIVFMSLDSALSIAVNVAAKAARIPTYILQHGLYTTYRDYRIRERQWNKKGNVKQVTAAKQSVRFSSVAFLLRSLRGLQKLWFIPFGLYAWLSRKKGYYWASRYVPFAAKVPDVYICFSPRNAIIHRQLDHPRENQFRYIGSAELDQYLKPVAERPIPEPYYVHIDQALAEHSMGEELVPVDKMISFYQTLNNFCLERNARLIVKLHPESYTTQWLPQHDNIVYLKRTPDLAAYLQHAEGCFGFYSTIVLPAVFWKKTVLFRVNYSATQARLQELGVALVLDYWTFNPSEITFDFYPERKEDFVQEFFYKTDGRSLERLSEILQEQYQPR